MGLWDGKRALISGGARVQGASEGGVFFCSSRRRHPRFDCDWSSDVCSSDLAAVIPPHTYCLLAESEWKRGDAVNALKDAEEETRRNDDCPRAHLIAGQIYRQQSQSQQALRHLRRAAQLDPEAPVQLDRKSTR